MFHRESGVFKTSYAADMGLYPLPIARWAVAAFAGLFIVIAPFALSEYYVSILNLILIACVGALGLNILVGYTGQISIGHGAFMSVGAKTGGFAALLRVFLSAFPGLATDWVVVAAVNTAQLRSSSAQPFGMSNCPDEFNSGQFQLMNCGEPKSPSQEHDMKVWLPGCGPGDLAASEINPLVWSRPA